MSLLSQEIQRAAPSRGMLSALRLVKMEWTANRIHRRSVKTLNGLTGEKSELLLHLGCGSNLKPGWINIDLFSPKADARLDLREDWPFKSDSVSRIYSEHVFEHLEHPRETNHFLAQTLRVLKPGGIVDIGVPDTEWPLKAYGDEANEYWKLAAERKWHPAYCETQLDHINYHFRQHGEHKYAWDAVTLTKELQKAGFASIERRAFDPTLDLESRKIGSLYLRAQKPA